MRRELARLLSQRADDAERRAEERSHEAAAQRGRSLLAAIGQPAQPHAAEVSPASPAAEQPRAPPAQSAAAPSPRTPPASGDWAETSGRGDALSDASDEESALAAPPPTPPRAPAPGGVRVVCRLRGAPAGSEAAARADGRGVNLGAQAFGPFERVLGAGASHGEAFDALRPLCAHAAAGGSALALLAGASGSGKTFSLWGPAGGPAAGGGGNGGAASEPALAVRALCELLHHAQAAAAPGPRRPVDATPASARAGTPTSARAPALRWATPGPSPGEERGGVGEEGDCAGGSVLVSLLQVYNGALYDLLGSGSGSGTGGGGGQSVPQPCGEQRPGRPAPPPLEVRCRTAADVRACLAIGGCFRRTAAACALHAGSSRAHTIVVARPVSRAGESLRGVLRLVDLAGAEAAEPDEDETARAPRTDAELRAASEAAHIQASLAALESAFGAMRARRPADFGASALTRALAPALDLERGAQVLLLAHVHEGSRWLDHSRRTLELAQLAGACAGGGAVLQLPATPPGAGSTDWASGVRDIMERA